MLAQATELGFLEVFKEYPWAMVTVAIVFVMQKFQQLRDKDRIETEAQIHEAYRNQIDTLTTNHADQIRYGHTVQQESNETLRTLTAEISKLRPGGRNASD